MTIATRLRNLCGKGAAPLGLAAFLAAVAPLPIQAQDVQITRIMGGLTEPWGLALLPDGGFLVTERGGRLLFVSGGKATTVQGAPKVFARGQGGLLDVMVPRDFARSREVFLTYAAADGDGAGTALGSARLSADGARLEGFRVLYQVPGIGGNGHFGSRVVEARDGKLFLMLGDRQKGAPAQDLSRAEGKVLRLNRDGSVPADNPFAGREGARPEIWSLGHRNIQGAALGENGALWVAEHGAKGGDEINRIEGGKNYGWPVISYGVNYNGSKIGEGTRKAGMEQPERVWDPSMAPSGLVVYSGRMWPEWRGDMLVGSLKFDQIERLDVSDDYEPHIIKTEETARVRDIREGADGSIWFLSVDNGAVYRMTR